MITKIGLLCLLHIESSLTMITLEIMAFVQFSVSSTTWSHNVITPAEAIHSWDTGSVTGKCMQIANSIFANKRDNSIIRTDAIYPLAKTIFNCIIIQIAVIL